MDKKLFKSILIIIIYTIVLVAVTINIRSILGGIGVFLSLLSPVFIGFCIAFVLNRPYSFFYKLYSKPKKKKQDEKPPKPKKKKLHLPQLKFSKKKKSDKKISFTGLFKALALLTVYVIFIAFLSLILQLILPEITDNISQLYENRLEYADNVTELVNSVGEMFPFNMITESISSDTESADNITLVETLTDKLTDFMQNLPQYISEILPDIVTVTKDVASSITNWLLGFVMSIYMLASKDSLLPQIKRMFYAFFPRKFADGTCQVLSISNSIFSSFVNGRLFDSLIVGMLCFIGMSIFGFQYTLLISVLVAVTNVIPIFGPFIGAIPSVFILLLVDPMQAVWFTVFIIVLQQIDGNIIGPKVVGESIGLPAWWVMFSITIGGGLLGITGMLAGVPTFAVIYRLLTNNVAKRLEMKEEAQ